MKEFNSLLGQIIAALIMIALLLGVIWVIKSLWLALV